MIVLNIIKTIVNGINWYINDNDQQLNKVAMYVNKIITIIFFQLN